MQKDKNMNKRKNKRLKLYSIELYEEVNWQKYVIVFANNMAEVKQYLEEELGIVEPQIFEINDYYIKSGIAFSLGE